MTFDVDFLADLLKQPERVSRTRKPKDTRDQDTWFKLEHILDSECSNENCISVELNQPKGRKRVVSEVNGHRMCRFCFLYGWHHEGDSLNK